MNYTAGMLAGSVIGCAGFAIGNRTRKIRSAGPLAGFGQLMYAGLCTGTGAALGFSAVALTAGNPIGLSVGVILSIVQIFTLVISIRN